MNKPLLLLQPFLLILFIGTLTACQNHHIQNYIADQNKQYLAAQATAPLTIPAPLKDTSLSDQQVIIPVLPNTNNPVVTAEPSLLPPGSMTARINAGTLSPSILKTPLPDPK